MQIGQKHASDLLSFQAKEAMKMHIEYDGSNRMEYVYVAPIDAEDGATCMATQYQYDGVSNRVSGMKESMSTWQAAWDF
jgi:hypothetical protein